MSPKITVILPNYNHSSFLNERMESILNQTYQNFELILLDDCSTDDSVSILNTFKNHPKVSQLIINEENSGSPFKHWQKGIELAKGDYIWIAESDDYCDPSFLEVLIPSLIDESVALAINYYILNYSLYEAHSNNIKSVFNQFTPDLICPQYYQIMTQIKNR